MKKKEKFTCASIKLPKFDDSCQGIIKDDSPKTIYIVEEDNIRAFEGIFSYHKSSTEDSLEIALRGMIANRVENNESCKPILKKLECMVTIIDGVKIYTVAQLADALNVTSNTIRTWIKQDKLMCQRIGNLIIITEKNLYRLLDNRF